MNKSATISMRVNPEVKAKAESVFADFGLSLSEAINVFLHKAIMEAGMPFEMKQPRYNAETEAAMEEARGIMNGTIKAKAFDSVEDFIQYLNEE